MKCSLKGCNESATMIVIGKETKGYCRLHAVDIKMQRKAELEKNRIVVEEWLQQLRLKYGE